MKTVVETITPEKALKYLSQNSSNRPLREHWVNHLAQQISSGNWQVTHQGIAFSKSGQLLDGQHRLTAIMRAGKAVDMSVTTGLADSVYKVTDGGMKRTTHDRIHLVDNKPANMLICQTINTYCRDALRGHQPIPISTVEDEFLRYADSWMWVAGQFALKQKLYGRTGVVAALAIYHVIDAGKAEEFSFGYRTGENLAAGSPILVLRRCVETTPSKGSSDYWRAVAAMRAHFKGATVRHLYDATEDMLGNKNSWRVVEERSERSRKGAASRKDRVKA